MSKSKRYWLIASMVLIAALVTFLVSFDKYDDVLYQSQLIESIERGDLTPEQEFKNKEIYLKLSEIEATNETTKIAITINHIIIIVLVSMFLTAFAYYVQSNWDMNESDNRDYVLSKFFQSILIASALIYLGSSKANAQTTSQVGINLIKHYEGFRSEAYQDVVGVWTIGYGTTKEVIQGQIISQSKAEYFLKKDLVRFERYVLTRIKRHIPQDQFDALVSFTYNIGSIYGNFYKAVVADRIEQVTYWINKYIKAGGKVYRGLVNRRRDEGKLYAGDIKTKQKYNPKYKVCYAK